MFQDEPVPQFERNAVTVDILLSMAQDQEKYDLITEECIQADDERAAKEYEVEGNF